MASGSISRMVDSDVACIFLAGITLMQCLIDMHMGGSSLRKKEGSQIQEQQHANTCLKAQA